ncbi:ribonuclease P protein component [Trueperella pecoris]|uniref:ribonuclease P protein component n=1 Tax=Trueperella pecoris TaxID=2733571 RepID=UPI00186B6DCB|nr:ribonuclease P protein component [Trueperella pecoris]QOQ39708.1 ribonuclease P protein component [Trueperella pecoris]
MLPAANRLRDPADFRSAFRSGSRKANRFVVVHALTDDPEAGLKVGFTVSKKVGNAVVRNKVRRRLRHIVRNTLGEVDAQFVVVRALPQAAEASYDELNRAVLAEFTRLGLMHD